MDYVRSHYPYSYEDNRDFLKKAQNDAEKTVEKVLDKLCGYARNTSRQELEESMHYAYKKACEEKRNRHTCMMGRRLIGESSQR